MAPSHVSKIIEAMLGAFSQDNAAQFPDGLDREEVEEMLKKLKKMSL